MLQMKPSTLQIWDAYGKQSLNAQHHAHRRVLLSCCDHNELTHHVAEHVSTDIYNQLYSWHRMYKTGFKNDNVKGTCH